METSEFFGKEKISKILLKLAPPVMLAQLIQALYNIVDSLFVGKYSDSGLTALSIVYPIQLLMIALAVGTGVGINTVMASKLGEGKKKESDAYAGVGTPLAIVLWALFALISWFVMPAFARMSTSSEDVIKDVVTYGRIVCLFSFGLFLESIWTKVLQANGNMKIPMIAQIVGAIVNIALDPLLIFGLIGLPRLGIAGAAIATVVGQVAAAAIVFKKGFRKSPDIKSYPQRIAKIFKLGTPNILMQSAYTFYIFGLNMILSTFSDQAVTALGLYYKWQTFFFIPLGAMQTCIVPVISYNYAAGNVDRCKKTLFSSVYFGWALMAIGTICFLTIPGPMLRVFTKDAEVIRIGTHGFHIIGISFIPMVTSLIFPVFFQAVGSSVKSSVLTIVRTLVLFVPLGYLFSLLGLYYFWLTFPVTETLTSGVGFFFYYRFLNKDYVKNKTNKEDINIIKPEIKESTPGLIITIDRQHGSSGKQIGKIVAEKLNIPFYCKEMIALAAHESGLDHEFIDSLHKESPEILQSLYLSTNVVRYAIEAQDKIIKKIANSGSCVIVGRAGSYVLKDYKNVIKIFVKAPKDFRIKRVMEVYNDTEKEAKKHIRKSDKARAAYYKHISGRRWGDAKNYDLVLDSSIGLEESANIIVECFLNSKNK